MILASLESIMPGISSDHFQSGAIGSERLSQITQKKIQKISGDIRGIDERKKTYDELDIKRKDLYESLTKLNSSDTLYAREIGLGNPQSIVLSATVVGRAALGRHTFNIQSLATPTLLVGSSQQAARMYAAAVSPTSSDAGPLLSALPLAGLKTGTLSINHQTLTVDFAQTLQEFFQAVQAATQGDIVGNYDPVSDTMTLKSLSGQDIVLGAPNDASNFWSAAHLVSNQWDVEGESRPSTLSTTSERTLGSVLIGPSVMNSHLKNATALVAGPQTLTLNAVSISYDPSLDSLGDIMQRIEGSGAGVQLFYNMTESQFEFKNVQTGSIGVNTHDSGSLLEALGLGAGGTLQLGSNARFQVDNGSVMSFPSNTLDVAAHGLPGLILTLKGTGTETVNILTQVEPTEEAVDKFLKAYNDFTDYVAVKSKVTITENKVIKGPLAEDTELRSLVNALRMGILITADSKNNTINTIGLGGSNNINDPKLILDKKVFEQSLVEKSDQVLSLLGNISTNLQAPLKPYINPSSRGIDSNQYKTPQKRLEEQKINLQKDIKKLETEKEKFIKDLEIQKAKIEFAQNKYGSMMNALNNLPSVHQKL